MSAELAALRPTYNNIAAGALRLGGAPFSFRAGVTSAKAQPGLLPPLALGSSAESGVTYNNITCGEPDGGAPPDTPLPCPTLLRAHLPVPGCLRRAWKEMGKRKEKKGKEKGKG